MERDLETLRSTDPQSGPAAGGLRSARRPPPCCPFTLEERQCPTRPQARDPALEPGRQLARDARRRQAGRPPRLRPPVDVGPPLRDLRRPVPADLRGLVAARTRGRSRPSGPGSGCSSAPTRSATRAWWPRSRRRSTTSATAARSWASAARGWSPSTRPTASTSGPGFGQRLDWLDEAVGGDAGAARRRAVTSEPGGHYDVRGPAPPPAAGPAAPADHDRRQRREEDPADRRPVRRHVERDGHARADGPQGRGAPRHCEDVGRDIAEIEFTLGVKLTIRDSEAEADRVWRAAMAHNRTPLRRRRGRRHVLERHRRADRRPAAAVRRARLPDASSPSSRRLRHRDTRAVHRRGEAAGGRPAEGGRSRAAPRETRMERE